MVKSFTWSPCIGKITTTAPPRELRHPQASALLTLEHWPIHGEDVSAASRPEDLAAAARPNRALTGLNQAAATPLPHRLLLPIAILTFISTAGRRQDEIMHAPPAHRRRLRDSAPRSKHTVWGCPAAATLLGSCGERRKEEGPLGFAP
jgi:hypothetical protein